MRSTEDRERDYQRRWRQANPDYQKQWRLNNPGYQKAYQKQWRKTNAGYHRRWELANGTKARIIRCRTRLKNWPKILEYKRRRRQTDQCYRLSEIMRCRVYHALRGGIKFETTINLLGCSSEQFKSHLESQFQPGMSWNNLGNFEGGWVIDHVAPIASFDLSTLQGQQSAFSYRNTRPLWWTDNVRKSSWHNGKRWLFKDHKPACTSKTKVATSRP